MPKHTARLRFILGAMAWRRWSPLPLPRVRSSESRRLRQPYGEFGQEDQLLNELNRISGRCTIPDQKACTIEQPAGRDWRHFHEVTLRWIGAISIRSRCSFSSI
jgi:formate dehydrogenase subunit gamma